MNCLNRTMKCAEIQDILMDFKENDPGSSIPEDVIRHIATCQQCAAFKDILQEMYLFIQHDKQAGTDPQMSERIMQATMTESVAAVHHHFTARLLRPAIFATVLAIVIAGGILIGHRMAYEESVSTDYQTELLYLNNIHQENQVIIPLSE